MRQGSGPSSGHLRVRTWLPPPAADTFALITGASSGIGAEIARSLARRRYGVLLVARRRDRLDALQRELSETGVFARSFVCDLTDAAARDRLAAEITARAWSVSVLVNGAGVGLPGHFTAVPVGEHLRLLRLNLEAVVDLSGRFLPPMVQRRQGAVLNICSLSSFVPWPSMATYAASKAAALSFSQALHTEVRPYGVAVTALCPGFVRTEFIDVAGLTDVAAAAPRWLFDRPERVAEHAIRALQDNRRVAVHSTMYRSSAAVLRGLPDGVVLSALDRWSPFRRGGSVAMKRGRTADPGSVRSDRSRGDAHEPDALDDPS